MKIRIFKMVIFILIFAPFSLWSAKTAVYSDFPTIYRAAKIVMTNESPAVDIYRIDDVDTAKYDIPENKLFTPYKYSMFATYLFSPLALFPYYYANAIMIFINIICYAISVLLILHAGGATGRRLLYPFALSFLWMPFFANIIFTQTNSILLLVITIAVPQAAKNKYVLTGILLAV